VKGTLDLMQKAYVEEWSITGNAFPNHLKSRGFTRTEPAFLRDFAYKEDGFLVWDAIVEYVRNSLASHYEGGKATVQGDGPLQAWLTAMRTSKADGGAQVNGVPGKVGTVAELTQLIAAIIFQATAQHSAVNFGQWEYYSFVPNRPLALKKAFPKDKAARFNANLMRIEVYFNAILTLINAV